MAGTAKPNNVGAEVGYSINDSVLYNSSLISKITDGVIATHWTDAAYLYNNTDYIDITFNDKVNIWFITPTDWPQFTALFSKVEKYNGTTWDLISLVENPASTTVSQWNKAFSNVEPGRYKFYGPGGDKKIIIGEAYFERADGLGRTPSITPEQGWTRIQDTDNFIVFNGSWSGLDYKYQKDLTSTIKFNFTGTGLRIICRIDDTYTEAAYVKIDGTTYQFTTNYEPASPASAICFDKILMNNSNHIVEIGNLNGTKYFNFDFIEIENGRLTHPFLAEKTSLKDMQVGDVISCDYLATSNVLGTFSNLGAATKALIPATSSATPDGSFYFIYVGHDSLGRKKLIADRNIQHSISWETINNLGFIFGGNFLTKYTGNEIQSCKVTSWLLDGGISSTNKDNSWDKIIAGYNLEGKTTAGNDLIWNYSSISEWTSTTDTTTMTNRVKRGVTLSAFSASPTSTVSTTIGYRPVIYIEELFVEKFMILKDSTYYGINDFTTATLSDTDMTTYGIEKLDVKTIVTQKSIQLPFKIIELTSLDKQTISIKLFKDYVKLKSKNAFKITHLKELNNFNCVGSNIKFALSLDNVVWKKYNGTSWETVDLTSINSTLFNSLNSLTEINTLSDIAFKQMLNVDSEFYLFIMFGKEGELDAIQMNIDLEGYFKLISSDVIVDEEKEEVKVTFPQDGNYRVKYQKLS